MKKNNIFILLLTIAFFPSCNSSNVCDNSLSDSVVIIFNNPPDQKWFYFNSGSYTGQYNHATLKYIGGNGLFGNFDPSPNGDTLTIPCFGQSHIIVSHKYKGIERHEFLLKQGDTVIINYDLSNFPLLTSKLSNSLTEMYNLNYNVKNRTVNYGFEPQSILNNMDFGLAYLVKKKSNKLSKKALEAFLDLEVNYIDLDSILVEHQKYINNFSELLDSLRISGNIDSTYLEFYTNRLNIITAQGRIKELYQKSKPKKDTEDKSGVFVLNDKLVYNFQYQNLLNGYLYNQTNKEGVVQYTTSNSRFSDYRTIFDNVAADESVPPLSKAVILAYCFDEICMNFKVDDKIAYYSKYLKLTNDTIKAKTIQERNKIDLENTTNLLLVDSNGKSMTFNEAIATHKGKVIYLDFWAPWCAPCREEMANSEKLHEYYKGKDVVFMNVVVFDTMTSWEKIKAKFEKNNQIHYYFATNSQSSKQLEELKVDLIPHFMVFDKGCRLIIQNAKRPSNPEVFNEIDRFL